MKTRTVEHPTVVLEHFYICEGCGKEYRDSGRAFTCEKKHVRDRCPHLEIRLVVDPDGGSIDRMCPACGLWFDDSFTFAGLPDDQDILHEIVAVIERAKVAP